MPTKIFKNNSFNNAEQFKESFFESDSTITYVFLSRHIPWTNDSSPPNLSDTAEQEKEIWDNMYAGKKVTGSDLELVIPWSSWNSGNTFKQYDNTLDFSELISTNTNSPFYVITSEKNVYKCLSNNQSNISTVEPTGNYTSSNGTISTADGYIWKYMFNVSDSNRFLLENEWIPVPKNVSAIGYKVSPLGVVNGQLTTIKISNAGINYVNVSSNSNLFVAGQTSLRFANTRNIVSNMAVTGNGIAGGTYVTSANDTTINISIVTTSAGGGTGNTILFSPRIVIDGDGIGAFANSTINSNGSIVSINLTSYGTNYSRANVFAYANGTNFSASVIIPPKFGHAYNPAKELHANNVMVNVRIGEKNSTEDGLIESNTNFRQHGLLINPYKYDETVKSNNITSNTIISQTTDLTVIAGSSYYINEFVYQGNLNSPSFSGYLQSENNNVLKITNIKGTPSIGLSVTGNTSATSRALVSVDNPEFEPYSGEIIFTENHTPIQRADGQSENIKFVVRF